MQPSRILVVDRTGAVAETVKAAAAQLGRRAEVAWCASLDDATAHAGPYDVVVAGPGLESRAGLQELERFADGSPASAVVLAFPRQPKVGARQLVRVGAVDLIAVPPTGRTMVQTLERSLALAGARNAGPAGPGAKRGTVVTVASATGGCGKTFYAVNAAWFLQRHAGGHACVVDLDLQFGEVTSALRLKPALTIFDAQQHHADEGDLRDHLDDFLVQHSTGMTVLAAPKDPAEADRIDPPDVLRILDAVRSRFDWVIVDTPPALTEVVLAALDISEHLFVMATLDVPSVRNLSTFLTTLDKLKVPTDSVRLVMNKAERGVGIEVDEVARLFPHGFSSVLPYAKEVSRAVNEGMPVLHTNPGAEVSRRLADGLLALLPEEARAAAAAANLAAAHPHVPRFSRLFHRPPAPAAATEGAVR